MENIGELAKEAFSKAFDEAYNAGHDILVVRDNVVWRINNAGKNELVKHLPPRPNIELNLPVGVPIQIKWKDDLS